MAKSNAKKPIAKKKSKASPPPPAAKRPRAKAKSAPGDAKYYLVASLLTFEVTDSKPAAGSSARQFDSFEDARIAAIESLVDAIENAEARLHALKQATTLAQCRAAGS